MSLKHRMMILAGVALPAAMFMGGCTDVTSPPNSSSQPSSSDAAGVGNQDEAGSTGVVDADRQDGSAEGGPMTRSMGDGAADAERMDGAADAERMDGGTDAETGGGPDAGSGCSSDAACGSAHICAGGVCVPGCRWTEEYVPNPPLMTGIAPSALATSGGQIYAATGPYLLTSSGNGTWSAAPNASGATEVQYSGIAYSASGAGFSVGQVPVQPPPYQGFFDTTVNGLWQPMTTYPEALSSVIALDPSDIFYVGASVYGLIGGTTKDLLPGNTSAYFEHVWGTSPSNVYAVGSNGAIAQGSTAGFSTQNSGVSTVLSSVWGLGVDDIYVVGSNDTFLHSTGSGTWTAVPGPPVPASAKLSDLWGQDDGDLYLATTNGMWRSTPDGQWHEVGPSAQTVWGTGDCNVYAITSDGRIYHSTP